MLSSSKKRQKELIAAVQKGDVDTVESVLRQNANVK